LSEGLAQTLIRMLKEEISADLKSKLGSLFLKSAFQRFSKRVDYAEYGGVPLLGVDGEVIVSHGASNPKAIMNAIRVAVQSVENRVSEHVLEGLKNNEAYYRKPHRFWDSIKKKIGS
jgi:phosphate acyltransferase